MDYGLKISGSTLAVVPLHALTRSMAGRRAPPAEAHEGSGAPGRSGSLGWPDASPRCSNFVERVGLHRLGSQSSDVRAVEFIPEAAIPWRIAADSGFAGR